MPGEAHEIIVKAIQDEPRIAAWLLDLADKDRRADQCTDAENRSTSVGSAGPVERRADAVVRLAFADVKDRIVICEVQNQWKNDKYYRLPGYMARAFEDYQLPVELILICGDDALARRYRDGIELGPDNCINVHAIGPSDLPDLAEAENPPSAAAAVITAVISRPRPGRKAELFISTLDRCLGTIEPGRAADYVMYLLTVLTEEPAELLEELMQTKARPYHSEYSDRLRSEGRQTGREEGRQEGREEGAIEHARSFLVRFLEGTSAGITEGQRERIEACSDLQQLDAWLNEVVSRRTGEGVIPE